LTCSRHDVRDILGTVHATRQDGPPGSPPPACVVEGSQPLLEDKPFYASDHGPQPPRQVNPGEEVWRLGLRSRI
jgi:hypothetical protein